MSTDPAGTMDANDIVELRMAIAEDLKHTGAMIMAIKEDVPHDTLEQIMVSWRATRFRRMLCEAATAIIRAMDCLKEDEEFSDDQAVKDVIKRWEEASDKDKEVIVSTLRAAFTKNGPSNNGNGKHP